MANKWIPRLISATIKGFSLTKEASVRLKLRYEDIVNSLSNLAETQDWMEMVNLGQTYEERDMMALEITKAGPGKPNVLIEGG